MTMTETVPKRPRGRQPLPPEERTQSLTTRVRPRHLRVLAEEAEETGSTLGETAREILECWAIVKSLHLQDGRHEEIDQAIEYGRRAADLLNAQGMTYEQILGIVGAAARQALEKEQKKSRSRRWRTTRPEDEAESA